MATDDEKPGEPKLKVKRKRRRLYDQVPEAETAATGKPARARKPKKTQKPPAKAAAPAAAEPAETVAEGTPQTETARKLVKKYSWGTAAVGLVPLPLVDFVAFSLLQAKMLKSLSQLYGVEYSEQRAKIFVGALVGSVTSVSVAGQAGFLFGSFLKSLSPVGYVVNASLMPATTGASTYAVGKVFIQHFESGGTLLDFEPEKMRGYYEQQYADARARA